MKIQLQPCILGKECYDCTRLGHPCTCVDCGILSNLCPYHLTVFNYNNDRAEEATWD